MNTKERINIYKLADEYRDEMLTGFLASSGEEMPLKDAIVAYSHIVNFMYWLMEKEREVKKRKEQKAEDEQTTTMD